MVERHIIQQQTTVADLRAKLDQAERERDEARRETESFSKRLAAAFELYEITVVERDEARRTALAANVIGPWAWIPGGENDLDTMVDDMAVTMTAGVLRGLLDDLRARLLAITERDNAAALSRATESERLGQALADAAFALVGHKHPRMRVNDREALRNAMDAWDARSYLSPSPHPESGEPT